MGTIQKDVIREVFKTMKYDMDKRESKMALSSEENTDHTHDMTEVVLEKFLKDNKWSKITDDKRSNLLNNLASEVEKAVDQFAMLQNTSSEYSAYVKQKAVPFLAETLRFYANLCALMKESKKGVIAVKIAVTTCFSLLGYVLGPALSAGHKVLLFCEEENCSLKLILTLLAKVGFPDETVAILPMKTDLTSVKEYVNIIYLLETTESFNNLDKCIRGLRSMVTPVIVFDNADLDSACECIINSTWDKQLLFNSTPREVLVQETVFQKFVSKLKEKVKSTNKIIDEKKYADGLKLLISTAVREGIEVFPENKDESFEKRLFIGGRLSNQYLPKIPWVSVTAFRNTDESIALANNNAQGLCASIWSENIGLSYQVALKLDVSNVWINSFGLYSPQVGFAPRKLSGNGFFGGIQAMYDLIQNFDAVSLENSVVDQQVEKIMQKSISSAKKAFNSWSSLPKYMRINKLLQLIQHIEETFMKNVEKCQLLDKWEELLLEYIQLHYDFSINSPIKGYQLNVSYSPKGVLMVEISKSLGIHNMNLIIAGLVEGNCLIIVNDSEQFKGFYNELSKYLPRDVLTVIPYYENIHNSVLKNPDIDRYFNIHQYVRVGVEEEFCLCDKITTVSSQWADIHSKVTNVKNVWSNIGQGYK